jgi:hypothetical protein
MSINCLNLKQSNSFIERLIRQGKPFSVTRVGIGSETYNLIDFIKNKNSNSDTIYRLGNNAGVYNIDKEGRKKYAEMYLKAISNSNALATFPESIVEEQECILKKCKIPAIHSRVIEPFHCCLNDISPWTLKLKDKKILVISPFIDSMKKQMGNRFRIFKDKDVFHPEQEFVFYKSYQTSAGNKPHKDWFETFEIMCGDIKELDFDIAILGCGGYGLPLCNFITKDLGKSSVYIGGGLQLLFGVMGKRWEKQNGGLWEKIIKQNGTKMIHPSGDEIPKNSKNVENGCYW